MKPAKKTVKASPKKRSIAVSAKKKIEYNRDFFQWTKQQTSLLKKKQFKDLDIANLIEEIRSLGKRDKRSLKSHLIILLTHLLKNQFHPEGKGNSSSWDASIKNSEMEIQLILEDSPSLKKELKTIYESAYAYAREKAAIESGLNIAVFPEKSPWKIQDIIT